MEGVPLLCSNLQVTDVLECKSMRTNFGRGVVDIVGWDMFICNLIAAAVFPLVISSQVLKSFLYLSISLCSQWVFSLCFLFFEKNFLIGLAMSVELLMMGLWAKPMVRLLALRKKRVDAFFVFQKKDWSPPFSPG